jgi:hypothetical protein
MAIVCYTIDVPGWDTKKEGKTMTEQKIINSIVEAYIKVMGQSKWDGLSDQQKHDVIMMIVNDMLKA